MIIWYTHTHTHTCFEYSLAVPSHTSGNTKSNPEIQLNQIGISNLNEVEKFQFS